MNQEKNKLAADLYQTEAELIHVKDKWREDIIDRDQKIVKKEKEFEEKI